MKQIKYGKRDWRIFRERYIPECNYHSLFINLTTVRLDKGEPKPLPLNSLEFIDLGINTKCNADCEFCYVSATNSGTNSNNLNKLWDLYLSKCPKGHKPYQVAIGSTGEPTVHPNLPEFLKHVYSTGVVPNYTTNGIILSQHKQNKKAQPFIDRLLEATRLYTGGVAVSYSNPKLLNQAEKAIYVLYEEGDVVVNLHHIISDISSVDFLIDTIKKFGDIIDYHALLPLMPTGRSTKGMDPNVFPYLERRLLEEDIRNIAFGANFYQYLKDATIATWKHPREIYSKNVLLKDNKVIITPNSFNLTPILEYDT